MVDTGNLGAVSDVLAGCLVLLEAGVMALTSRLNSDWLDDIGVATELAPSVKFRSRSKFRALNHAVHPMGER